MRLPPGITVLALVLVAATGCGEGAAQAPSDGQAGSPPTGGSSAAGQAGQGGGGTSSGGGDAQAGSATAGSAGAASAMAGGGQGGSAAGGGMAGGGSAGAASDVCAPGNVCDGFEGADFGAWHENGNGGTIELDATHVFNGARAVQFVSVPGASKRSQLERTGAPVFPAMGNVFWGRVMAYAQDLPMKSDKEDKNVHYDLIQASGEEPGEYRVAGMGGVLLNYEPHDCYFGTQKPIPEDKWACWEWLFDGEKNVIEFYIDGVQQARIEGMGQGCVDGTDSTWQAPTFNELRIGWVNYQSKAETTTLWLDEFAVGPERVGCLEPTAATH